MRCRREVYALKPAFTKTEFAEFFKSILSVVTSLRPTVKRWSMTWYFYLSSNSEYTPVLSKEALARVKHCGVYLALLGGVALVRGVAGYSHKTFLWTICPSVGRSVCLSSALWKNGGSDPDAVSTVWHHRSDGSRDEAGSGVWGSVHAKGYFWDRFWGAPL